MAETKKKNIYETISEVMAEIGAIGKNDRNDQQKFMYRGIDAVMNALNPALIKCRMFVVPEVMEQTREERQARNGGNLIYSVCKIKYTFYAEDGSSVSAVVVGEGMDSGDKSTNKAMSVAFKYACFQVFCIPTEEMVDPDAECHEVKPKAAPAKADSQPKPDPVQAEPQSESSQAKNIDPELLKVGNELKKLVAKCGYNLKTVCQVHGLTKTSTIADYKEAIENVRMQGILDGVYTED